MLILRIVTILMLIACLTSKADLKLFNKDCPQYKRWQTAKKTLSTKQAVRRSIVSAAQYVGVPHKILLAVCFVESSHRELDSVPDGSSLSYGVCQVKLETAEYMDRLYGLVPVTPEALSDTWTNAYYAAKYLQFQYKRYGDWKRAIDAYNKGKLVSDSSQYVHKVLLALQENR
jgi:soluble lytic murein transglycosylase-like protein